MSTTQLKAILLSLVFLSVWCSCAGGNSDQPEQAARKYGAALRSGQFEQAYELMSDDFRRRTDKKTFVRLLDDAEQEVKYLADQLGRDPISVTIRAELPIDGDTKIRLMRQRGVWMIDSDPLEFYGQQTPRQALRAFVRALERRRYDVVLRFVPNRWRKALTADQLRTQWERDKREELEGILRHLKANLDSPISEEGDRATMAYGERFEVQFIREDGVWKIEEPD